MTLQGVSKTDPVIIPAKAKAISYSLDGKTILRLEVGQEVNGRTVAEIRKSSDEKCWDILVEAKTADPKHPRWQISCSISEAVASVVTYFGEDA